MIYLFHHRTPLHDSLPNNIDLLFLKAGHPGQAQTRRCQQRFL